ncbi:MAG: hypothetical protein L0H12_03965 [Nitrosospira sp.]|nr:hypothetical protein [Nitrosospira sp.]
MRSSPPRWYRRIHTKKLRAHNRDVLHRWRSHPDTEPVFINHHYHSAQWDWW